MASFSCAHMAFKPAKHRSHNGHVQRSTVRVSASSAEDSPSGSRRHLLLSSAVALGSQVLLEGPALAVPDRLPNPPDGFNRHLDRLDAYSFVYPNNWSVVTTTGNDVFYTNPRVADENVFVDVSSPSSSKYKSVTDLGTPDEASEKLQKILLREFMSTRLGVKRTVEPLSAVSRMGSDGKEYYDIAVRVQSYGSRQQLAVKKEEIDEAVILEFDRVAITTLGAANNRLYQFRVQTPYKRYTKDVSVLETMTNSFQCWDLPA